MVFLCMTSANEHPDERAQPSEHVAQIGSAPNVVPPKRQGTTDQKLLESTIAFWQPRAGRSLNEEDARQILENLRGFFAVLDGWDRAEQGPTNVGSWESP